jgi:hypothetical protein
MKLIEQIQQLDFPAPLPEKLLAVAQRFDAPRVSDVVASTREAMRTFTTRIEPGSTVAVGVGSRGIANLPVIVRAVMDALRECGARPFVMPAMGSHGGATIEGQIGVLADLGVTPDSIGVEFRATMDVREIGKLPDGPGLFQDVLSSAADHTLLISRIKPHTNFHGDLESGPSKMCVIGLGRQRGASAMHTYGSAGFRRWLATAARIYEANTNVLGALTIIENAHDETAEIGALTVREIGTAREMALLQRARTWMASIPFAQVEVLVVKQLGKNISGNGMDTNIINRMLMPRTPEPSEGVNVAVIAALDLTKETHGNASGIGLANVTTQRLVDKTDWVTTYTNAITSGMFGMFHAAVPLTLPDDRRALQVALRGCGQPYDTARWVFIENTLKLDVIWASENLRDEIQENPRLKILGEIPLVFEVRGMMTSPWQME